MCRAKTRLAKGKPKKPTHHVEDTTDENTTDESEQSDSLHTVEGKSRPPYVVDLSINDVPLRMEVDTGASRTLVSEATYRKFWKRPPKLLTTHTRLRTYSGEQLVVLGTLRVTVKYEAQQVVRSLLVVKGAGPSLFGRDWLEVIKLNWRSLTVHYSTQYRPLDEGLVETWRSVQFRVGES